MKVGEEEFGVQYTNEEPKENLNSMISCMLSRRRGEKRTLQNTAAIA